MSSLVASNSTSQYDDVMRRRVIAEYAVSGNIKKVAAITDIPDTTIGQWLRTSWGIDLLATIRVQNQDMMSAKYTAIIERNLDAQIDRLDNGDIIGRSADGELLRAPIKYRDLVVGGGIAVDKVRLLNNQATSITVTDNALTKISAQLAAFAVDKHDKRHTIEHDDSVSD